MFALFGCEESQAVCIEFRKRGHQAFSCDLEPCSGGYPEWHFQMDVFEVIKGGILKTQAGTEVFIPGWDMGVFFPPCTDLAMSGAKHFEKKREDGRQQKSIDFFMAFTKTNIPKWAIENPIGIMSTIYRKPDQIINPYDFDDAAQKPTCLWLKGLPKLQATNLGDAPLFGHSLNKGEFHVTKSGKKLPKWYNLPPSKNRATIRSKTFPGIAKAMGA